MACRRWCALFTLCVLGAKPRLLGVTNPLFGVTSAMVLATAGLQAQMFQGRDIGIRNVGRRNREKKETQRHRIVMGGQLSEYWMLSSLLISEFACVYFSYTFMPQYKRAGEKATDCFNRTQSTSRTVLALILETSSHYFLSKAFDVWGRVHPRPGIL